eukprot:467090-Prymnesium_polylepis.1
MRLLGGGLPPRRARPRLARRRSYLPQQVPYSSMVDISTSPCERGGPRVNGQLGGPGSPASG